MQLHPVYHCLVIGTVWSHCRIITNSLSTAIVFNSNFSDVSGKENNNQCSTFGESGSSPGNNEKENSQSSTMPLSQETNLPVNLHQSSSLDLADISGPSGRKSIGSG